MKKLTLPLLTACLLLASCSGNTKPAPEQASTTEITKPIVKLQIPQDSALVVNVFTDTAQQYTVYYPKTAKGVDSCPVLVCFDPHGDGGLPIIKYKKWADKFGIAIAGSNSSKNGISANNGLQIANNMINDLNAHVGFSKKNMVLCGFSGGAKVAINAILNNNDILNLIYAGAVTRLNTNRPLNILGFAGNEDMNYTDLLQFNESVKGTNPDAVLIEFNGKHEWPDTKIFEKAFYWVYFKCGVKDSSALKKNIRAFTAEENEAITTASHKGAIYALEENRVAYSILHGVEDVSVYEKNINRLLQLPAYKTALAEKNNTLEKEANQKSMLIQAFQTQGGDWWQKVIKGLQASASASDKRLLGFISLACYSYSSQLLSQHNLDAAEKILAIYELCDPQNTDQLYFHAVLYAQKANNTLALNYLEKAAGNKFSDWQKTEAEPAFNPLKADPRFAGILAALKKASK